MMRDHITIRQMSGKHHTWLFATSTGSVSQNHICGNQKNGETSKFTLAGPAPATIETQSSKLADLL
jgi:hypothetical protein